MVFLNNIQCDKNTAVSRYYQNIAQYYADPYFFIPNLGSTSVLNASPYVGYTGRYLKPLCVGLRVTLCHFMIIYEIYLLPKNFIVRMILHACKVV